MLKGDSTGSSLNFILAREFPDGLLDDGDVIYFKGMRESTSADHRTVPSWMIPDFPAIRDRALNAMARFVAELSKVELTPMSSVRDLSFMGFPVFWATGLSEKHPIWHWVRDAFCALEVMKSGFCADYQRVVICVEHSAISEFLAELFSEFSEQVDYRFEETTTVRLKREWVRLGKNSVRLMKRRPLAPQVQSESGLIYILNTDGEIDPKVFPIFSLLNQRSLELESPIETLLLPGNHPRTSMSLRKSLLYSRELIRTWSQLRQLPNDATLAVEKKRFPTSLLIFELLEALNNNLFIILDIFESVESMPSDRRYVYEDEVYVFGRIVSHFWNLRGFHTTGIQHGAIYDSQSVYAFSGDEFRGDKALTLPRDMILWENYFPEKLRSTLGINLNVRCLPSPKGNLPTHDTDRENGRRLLWCITLPELARIEVGILGEALKGRTDDYDIVIRNHPHQHISDQELLELSAQHNLNVQLDDRKNILDEIGGFHAVLVSAHSTVVIDMLSINMPVVGFLGKAFGVSWLDFDVETPEQLQRVLDELSMQSKPSLMTSFPCEEWDRFIQGVDVA